MRPFSMPLLLGFGLLCPGCSDDGGAGEEGSTGAMATTTTMPGTSSSTAPPMTTTEPMETGSTSLPPGCECADASRCDADGRCRRYVFVTRDPLTLGADARADADAMCSAAAAESDLLPDGDYLAFLSADGTPPWNDIGLDSLANAVFVLPDDTAVGTADQLTGAQLGMDMLDHAIDQDQTGQPLHGDYEDEACAPDPHGVWTGVEANLFSGTCNSWAVDMDGYTGVVGDALAVDATWTSFCSSGCSMFTAHVYCFEVF